MTNIIVYLCVLCLFGCTPQIGSTTQPTVVFQPGAIVVTMQVGGKDQPVAAANITINGKLLAPAPTTRPATRPGK